jgi:N4-gp56 family major capsid protein
MASNGFLEITDAEVLTQWESGVDIEARLRLALLDDEYGFAGESEDSLVVLKDDLTTKAGGTIRSYFAYQLHSRGRAKDAQLVNFEDRARTSTFDVKVDVLRNAVAVESPMFQQWVNYNMLETSKRLLGDWFATRIELGLHAHATGANFISLDEYNLNNTITAVQSAYIVRPNGKAAGALTSGDTLDVDVINEALMLLNLQRPKIRPANTPFGPKYVCFLSSEHVRDLRKSDSVWFQIMQAAIQGGEVDGNPIFNNLLGSVHDVLFYKSDLVPPGHNTGGTAFKSKTRRAWIGGAGALNLAFGRGDRPSGFGVNRFQWDMDTQDYGFRKMVAASTIIGGSRPYFTDPADAVVSEQGVIVIETFADYGSALTDAKVYRDWIEAGATVEA